LGQEKDTDAIDFVKAVHVELADKAGELGDVEYENGRAM
jgi:hypothetical protein